MIFTDEAYPEIGLASDDFRVSSIGASQGLAREKYPRVENSFYKGEVFIITAFNKETKEWVTVDGPGLAPEGHAFRIGGTELLQWYRKFLSPPVETATILELLGALNSITLKTETWRLIRTPGSEELNKSEDNKVFLVVQIPEK